MNINRKIIYIAIILGALVTFGAYRYINTANASKLVGVWVAKKDIPAKTKLDLTMVEIRQVAQAKVVKNAMTNESVVLGKCSQVPIAVGEQLTSSTLTYEDKSKFSYQIPKDKIAVTIEVDGIAGVAYLIKPGDFVDAFVFLQQEKFDDRSSTIIYPNIEKLIVQNIQVLAVDKDNNLKSSESADGKGDQKTKNKITLALSQTDAEKLMLGDNIGKLRLALKNPDNSQSVATDGSIRLDLAPEKGKKVLSK